MNKIVLALVAVAAILGTGLYLYHAKKTTTLSTSNIPTPVYDLWVHWKNTHSKQYLSSAEEQHRLNIFYQNYLKIQQHQSKNDRTYDMGFNHLMDLTASEFKAKYLTLNSVKPQTNIVELDTTNIAASVDWRTKGAVTAVKDQGQCGSCWAFSTTGSLEGLHFLKTGKLTAFSEQQLVDCSTSEGNQGCNGGLMDQAFTYVKGTGIETEDQYPYTAQDGTCQSVSGGYTIKSYVDVPVGSDAQLKAAVNLQPVSIAVDAESWQFYSGGVFSDCSTSLDHGVLLVGYTSEAWIVKNSWAEGWGENGYIRLALGNTCGLENAASYPTA